MSDLISRQAAIDALCDEYCGGWQDCKHYPKCENLKAIQNLPSALPEQCEDAVSRQAAIDAVMECYDNDELFEVYEWKLNELPPIQPKRGRWEMGIDERSVECSECGLMTTRNELRGIAVFGKNEPNFCPNCGAKMEVTE